MSNVIRFPNVLSTERGQTYIVPDDAETPRAASWLVYRLPPGADEPSLLAVFDDLLAAVDMARDYARDHRDRLVIDEGVQS